MMHDEMNVPSQRVGMDDVEWARFQAAAIEAKGEKAKRKSPLYVATVQRQGWLCPMKVYMCWCDDCRLHTVGSLSGYGNIKCANCRMQFNVMTWLRFRDFVFAPLRTSPLWPIVFVASAASIAALVRALTP